MNLQLQCASEICADDYQNEDGENANDLPNDRIQQQQQQRRANNFKNQTSHHTYVYDWKHGRNAHS